MAVNLHHVLARSPGLHLPKEDYTKNSGSCHNSYRGNMVYRRLPLRCECGRVPRRVKEVGLTPGHQLVIHWRCRSCKRKIYVARNLADCWRLCPKPKDQQEVCVSADLMREPDAEFLHRLGVKFPDD
jgi:hypothetical protein